jgi:hypothetical protein
METDMTNTSLRGQLTDAFNGREPLTTDKEEELQAWGAALVSRARPQDGL